MFALTLTRPWGIAVMRHGKDIENRVWAPVTQLKPGDRFAIHNALKIDPRGVAKVMEFLRDGRPAHAVDMDVLCGPPGVILGTVRFCGIVRGSTSTWFEGPVGWVLADPRPLRDPIACRGQQRLWAIPAGIEELMR